MGFAATEICLQLNDRLSALTVETLECDPQEFSQTIRDESGDKTNWIGVSNFQYPVEQDQGQQRTRLLILAADHIG